MKTGSVQEMQTEGLFALHHVNAYETDDGSEILLDLSPAFLDFFGDFLDMEFLLNPPEFSNGTTGSTCAGKKVTRYHINLNSGSISSSTFPNQMDSPNARYLDCFDFPSINEAYRGKEVKHSEFLFKMSCFYALFYSPAQ